MLREIGDALYNSQIVLKEKIDAQLHKEARVAAREAILLVHAAGGEGQRPLKTFTSGYLDLGNFAPGSVFRVNQISGEKGRERRTYDWYVVGKSGKKPTVYLLLNPPKSEAELVEPQSSTLKLEPGWNLWRVRKPEVTAFFMDQAQTALSGQLLDPPGKKILEWREQYPEKVVYAESIDLIHGGLVKRQEVKQISAEPITKLSFNPQRIA